MMAAVKQRIAFVRTKDNTNIAYAESGSGPALVRAGTWLTHLHHDWESPVWMHWLQFMSSRPRLVRYDPRGCGLSHAHAGTIGFEDWVGDLEAVVDHLELERFALFGMSQGAAVAAEYAIRHPERVSHLTLYAPLVTGWRGRSSSNAKQWQSIEQLVALGWGESANAFAASSRTCSCLIHIGEKTVRNRITHIFGKLGVSSRAQAAVAAREAGL
jgi:pimeloyl-ACP methyl ester carboxylesterase